MAGFRWTRREGEIASLYQLFAESLSPVVTGTGAETCFCLSCNINQAPMDGGELLRDGFLFGLKHNGIDCHAGGEARRALVSMHKEAGDTVFQFAEEFAIVSGDVIRNEITEETFTVASVRPVATDNTFVYLEVVAMRG